MRVFEDNLVIIFVISPNYKNIRCGYSLESYRPPRGGDSNEYPPQHMFLWRLIENYPLSPNTLLICSTEINLLSITCIKNFQQGQRIETDGQSTYCTDFLTGSGNCLLTLTVEILTYPAHLRYPVPNRLGIPQPLIQVLLP